MSIKEKVNNYLLEKVAKSKVQYLFAVSKVHLLERVHELNKSIEYLGAMNENLVAKNEILQKELTKSKREYNTLKTEREATREFNYELAYKGLVAEYESLKNENRNIKASVEVVGTVVESTKKQNEQLKERLNRTEAENERLQTENKKYKENDKVVDLKENKKINIRHNYTASRNNSSKLITRQVNN